MRGQPKVTAGRPRIRSLLPRVMTVLACAAGFALPGAASAQCVSYSISDPGCVTQTVNNEFLKDTRLTSGLLAAGPPEVAREIALINGAMFDAANAASGSPYASLAYAGGPVAGASVSAAVLQAGITALNGIFGNDIINQVNTYYDFNTNKYTDNYSNTNTDSNKYIYSNSYSYINTNSNTYTFSNSWIDSNNDTK